MNPSCRRWGDRNGELAGGDVVEEAVEAGGTVGETDEGVARQSLRDGEHERGLFFDGGEFGGGDVVEKARRLPPLSR